MLMTDGPFDPVPAESDREPTWILAMLTDRTFWLSVGAVVALAGAGGALTAAVGEIYAYPVGFSVGMITTDVVDWLLERGFDD